MNFIKKIILILIFLISVNLLIMILFNGSIDIYFWTIIISSLLYLTAILLVMKINFEINEIVFIGLIFLVLKLISINILPIGSDDYYRYLWDGKVLVNGINPFEYAPNSDELQYLHSELLPGKVTYPDIKTIYFPFSQAAFAISHLISGEKIFGLKVVMLLTDLLIIIGLYLILKREKISYKYLLIYLVSPLVFYQFFIDAHIDLIGILFFVYVLLFYKKNKYLAAIFFGASIAVKPALVVLLPLFIISEKDLKYKLIWGLLPLSFLFITFIPFFINANPFETLLNFSKHWTFNGLVYNILSVFLNNNYSIRIISLVLFGLIYLAIIILKREIHFSLYYVLLFLFLFSPILHPWYAAWILPLLVIYNRKSGILLVSLISFSFYTVMIYHQTGIWKDYWFILVIEYTTPLFFLILDIKREIKGLQIKI